ncbi:hypothetical protein [Allocoleopsis sp.]|uniref:hypothetical protein n=1 Tax=Allocoleopsis sp. TaxID=3088169 RepID=UPI002FD6ED22
MFDKPNLLKKLTLALISAGLSIVIAYSMLGLEVTETDKQSWRNLDLPGCQYDSNTGVWCPELYKRDR